MGTDFQEFVSGFLWPAYISFLRDERARDHNTVNTHENAAACREAKIGFLRLVLDLNKFFETGAVSQRLLALPPPVCQRLKLPPPQPRQDADELLLLVFKQESCE